MDEDSTRQGQAPATGQRLPIDSPSAQFDDRFLKMKGQILVEELSSGGPVRSGQRDGEGLGAKNAPAIANGDPHRAKAKFSRQAQVSPDSSQGLTSVVQVSDGLSNIYYKGEGSAG